MAIPAGTRLGSYEVIATLGAGGMGEVYRARDTKLGREVALKLILEAFVTDRDRLARFEREARMLAALNHPNIATLYGLEEADGRHFLVMELVPGLTLRDLIARTPEAESVSPRPRVSDSAVPRGGEAPRNSKEDGIPLDLALSLARQIAEGLEAAHERGIVHRDLKPANIKITADGKVKVLDFGLATTGRSDASDASGSLANSPTLTAMGTLAGAILGTASYMSPEQARGMGADHRSDIFSFGVVLFEMLTGRQPFQGETVSDVLASVLAREPDLASLPAGLPPRLSELVARCLEKQPKRRWQAIGDIRHELEVVAQRGSSPGVVSSNPEPAPGVASPLWRRALPVAAAVLVTGGITIAATALMRPAPPPAAVTRFTVPYAEGLQLTVRPGIAISPDGSRMAYVLNRRLYVRELGAFEGRAVTPGANAAGGAPVSPVFSPDGTQLAYFDNVETALKVVSTLGGPMSTVCKLPEMPAGLSWSGDFIYMGVTAGIQRVTATGGSPDLVIKKDPEDLITGPQVLDDGRMLYSIAKREPGILDRWVNARIVVQRPGDPQPTVIVEKGSDPRYLRSGHLVYVYGGVLYARRLILDSAKMTVGPQTPMVEGVFRSAGTVGAGLWWYGVSDNGTLVYQPGTVGAMGEQQLAIALFARDGKIEPTKIRPGPYWHPRMSPDGRRIAFGVDDGREVSLWVYDIAGNSAKRLTFGGRSGGRDRYPVWSQDSQRLIFQSDRDGSYSLYSQAADGSDSPIRLTTPDKTVEHVPQSVSPDGKVLLFDETRGGVTFLKSYAFKDKAISSYGDVQSVVPTGAVFSRNGRWVAYTVRPAQQSLSMIEVQPYPASGPKYQVSLASEDGHHAIWSYDDKELFYTPGPGALFNSVTVNTGGPAFSFAPGQGFARKFANMAPSTERPYDIARNAKGEPLILGLSSNTVDPTKEEQIELRVVVNWVEELKARVK